MTETKHDDLFDASVTRGLRELDGLETPPDVTERVLAGAPTRVTAPRRSTNAIAAILVVALGLATAIGVWFHANQKPESVPVAPQQDPLPQLPSPVTIRAGSQIAAHPVSTENVICHDFKPEDVRKLRRFAKLRGVTFRGPRFDPSGLAELPRLDKLEWVTVDFVLTPDQAAEFRALRSLPRLRVVGATFTSIDDEVLRGVAAAKRIDALALRGDLECSAAGMARLGKDLPRLRYLSLGPLPPRDPGPLAPGPGKPHDVKSAVWDALPESVVELSLHRQNIPAQALRRLPGLKKLDLFESHSVGRELLQLVSNWPDCMIIAPSGAHLKVDAKGRCEAESSKVVMIQRKDSGAYRAAGYSFRYLSSDLAEHRNEVDLLFDSCGSVHVSMFGGCENRVLDLGAKAKIPAIGELPQKGWLKDSFRPVAGHRYVMQVRHGREGEMFVQFDVVKADGNRVWLEWKPMGPEQVWGMAPRPNRARAGTKGECGGPHRDG